MPWNKGRLAYTPLGPYIAKRYEEGLSYGKIAKEVGIYKSCVQNLCRAMGVKPRENHTTSIASVWEQRLEDYVVRTGAKVIGRPGRLTKSSRILTECRHGISERPCQVLEGMTFCCKSGSKSGLNNPGQGWGLRPHYRSLPGILYLIRYLDKSGTHFKIGMTSKKLSERFGFSQLVSVIQTWILPLGKCFDLEQAALSYAEEHGHRYSSPTTTELIRPEGILPILEFIEHSISDGGYLAQFEL